MLGNHSTTERHHSPIYLFFIIVLENSQSKDLISIEGNLCFRSLSQISCYCKSFIQRDACILNQGKFTEDKQIKIINDRKTADLMLIQSQMKLSVLFVFILLIFVFITQTSKQPNPILKFGFCKRCSMLRNIEQSRTDTLTTKYNYSN